jgi:hypothetical protein
MRVVFVNKSIICHTPTTESSYWRAPSPPAFPDPEERFGVEDVLAHAWYLEGLNPAVSCFNNKLLAKLQCSGIPEKVILLIDFSLHMVLGDFEIVNNLGVRPQHALQTVQEVKAVVKAARSLGKIVEESDTGSGAGSSS